ncbi:crotonase/enoyl-CoA hydratase family protein [Pseudohalioglobus sediminis]|uniref:Crotonase/enoyl-CoA hydratase family protein n=1 Tax=Pseudohalioglobus sediminis TaxID=2606449 RepID=A0A5B0X6R9_9GAMM|nr:crotonase/enoyl-CoA hydratase family protein [Pseudohalioglobus sediminis]KAA1194041.1 crotonase/enoyl-CoA hydratase family protein [Pseudohalioglobus sediminis]
MQYNDISYQTDGRIARITLDRPERLNAISMDMPGEIADAVARANKDDDVHVIVLTGAGRAFCSGYDLVEFAEEEGEKPGSQLGDSHGGPWDPMLDFYGMFQNTQNFMSLWKSYKPTIARVQGPAVAGGSDIALACDMVIMADEAVIGYPPARVWGCPTTAMWVYRLGAEKAKRMLLTGDLVSGPEAVELGLVLESVPQEKLDERVDALAARMAGVPKNQLMMQKLMINQAYENMGLNNTQMFATLFDGITRHSPEGVWFKQRAEEVGFKQAVRERDSGQPIAEGVSRPLSPYKSGK